MNILKKEQFHLRGLAVQRPPPWAWEIVGSIPWLHNAKDSNPWLLGTRHQGSDWKGWIIKCRQCSCSCSSPSWDGSKVEKSFPRFGSWQLVPKIYILKAQLELRNRQKEGDQQHGRKEIFQWVRFIHRQNLTKKKKDTFSCYIKLRSFCSRLDFQNKRWNPFIKEVEIQQRWNLKPKRCR